MFYHGGLTTVLMDYNSPISNSFEMFQNVFLFSITILCRPVAGLFQGGFLSFCLGDEKRLAWGGGGEEKELLIKRQFGLLYYCKSLNSLLYKKLVHYWYNTNSPYHIKGPQ